MRVILPPMATGRVRRPVPGVHPNQIDQQSGLLVLPAGQPHRLAGGRVQPVQGRLGRADGVPGEAVGRHLFRHDIRVLPHGQQPLAAAAGDGRARRRAHQLHHLRALHLHVPRPLRPMPGVPRCQATLARKQPAASLRGGPDAYAAHSSDNVRSSDGLSGRGNAQTRAPFSNEGGDSCQAVCIRPACGLQFRAHRCDPCSSNTSRTRFHPVPWPRAVVGSPHGTIGPGPLRQSVACRRTRTLDNANAIQQSSILIVNGGRSRGGGAGAT